MRNPEAGTDVPQLTVRREGSRDFTRFPVSSARGAGEILKRAPSLRMAANGIGGAPTACVQAQEALQMGADPDPLISGSSTGSLASSEGDAVANDAMAERGTGVDGHTQKQHAQRDHELVVGCGLRHADHGGHQDQRQVQEEERQQLVEEPRDGENPRLLDHLPHGHVKVEHGCGRAGHVQQQEHEAAQREAPLDLLRHAALHA
mmetsp:Transcript_10938/g.28265  ORF Transcript_10938/g.28265 Transcript_10938/m.28265 type:complete len:204 (+) Transcript_10938:181-792(+)